MIMTDKIRSNIWMGFAIFSLICVVSRVVHLVQGDKEWWELVTTIIMTALCVRFSLCYRKKAQEAQD